MLELERNHRIQQPHTARDENHIHTYIAIRWPAPLCARVTGAKKRHEMWNHCRSATNGNATGERRTYGNIHLVECVQCWSHIFYSHHILRYTIVKSNLSFNKCQLARQTTMHGIFECKMILYILLSLYPPFFLFQCDFASIFWAANTEGVKLSHLLAYNFICKTDMWMIWIWYLL